MDTIENANLLSRKQRPIVDDFLTKMRTAQEQLREAQLELNGVIDEPPVNVLLLAHNIKAVSVIDTVSVHDMLNTIIDICKDVQTKLPSSKEFIEKYNSLRDKPRRSRRLAAKPRKSYAGMCE
jgi:hypothetical protein